MYKALSNSSTGIKDFTVLDLDENENLLSKKDMIQGSFTPSKSQNSTFGEVITFSKTRIRLQSLLPISSPFTVSAYSNDYQVAVGLFGKNGYLGFSKGYKNWSSSIKVNDPDVTSVLICIRKITEEVVTPEDFIRGCVMLEKGLVQTDYQPSIFDNPSYSSYKFIGSSKIKSKNPRDYKWDLRSHDLEKTTLTYGQVKMKIEDYWDRGITGKNVKIGILDNGIATHDALPVSGGLACQGWKSYISEWFHGTHCAGIALGRNLKNGKPPGVAPDASLYVIRMSYDSAKKKVLSIIDGINYAIEEKLDILSMSVGIHEDSSWDNLKKVTVACPKHLRIPLRDAFVRAYEHGLIILVAGGNNNDGRGKVEEFIGILQKMPNALSIANLTLHDERYGTSSVGRWIDAAGYGTSIMSAAEKRDGRENIYVLGTGTSMATPSISGVFALYRQLFPKLSGQELIEKVFENCTPVPELTEYQQGRGVPQPPKELYEIPINFEAKNKIRMYDEYCWKHVDTFYKTNQNDWKELEVVTNGK